MSNVPSKVQFRRADASAWTLSNPTLAAGELGFELDTGKFKIGNGNDDWNNLGYASSGGGGGGGSQTVARFTQVFTRNGSIQEKLYPTKFVADGNYNITKARAVVGTHDALTHPADGCPEGGPIYIKIWKYNTSDASPQNIFATETDLRIEADTHKDTEWVIPMITSIQTDQILRIEVASAPETTSLGQDLTVVVVLEPV